MVNIKWILRFFDLDFIRKNLLIILLFALIPFGEILVILYLGEKLGKFLVLAATAATGLLGFFLCYSAIRKILSRIRQKIRTDQFPDQDFLGLAGALLGSVLLITPGFFTDILGLLMFFPGIRTGVGGLVVSRFEIQLKELYEYLRLYDF